MPLKQINRVMERTSNCCTVASLATLVILVLFPVRSWCTEEAYRSLAEPQSVCCSGDAALKRFDDIDYDSFVSLMGRRSAAQPNRDTDRILAALLGRRTRMACPCAKEYSQTRSDIVNNRRQRFQRFL